MTKEVTPEQLKEAFEKNRKKKAEMCQCNCHRVKSRIIHIKACCRYSGILNTDFAGRAMMDKYYEKIKKDEENGKREQ